MYSVLEDRDDDDAEMESVPSVEVPVGNHIGNVVVFVQFNQWKNIDTTTYLGLVSKKIACGTIEFEGNNKKENCSLAIYPDDKACNKRIRMMASLHHPNLLNGMVYGLRGKPPQIQYELALNHISGTMENFLQCHFKYFFSHKTDVLSDRFMKFLRVLIDAISAVHHKGFCHGNVQRKNIFYLKTNDDFMFFIGTYDGKEQKNVRKGQVYDWHGLGWIIESIMIDYINVRQKERSNSGKGKEKIQDKSGSDAYQDFICIALKNLIKILKAAEEKNLINMKDKALNSLAFQKIYHRQRYMTVVIPYFMRCKVNYNKMLDSHSSNLVKMPWTSSCGLYYQEMTNYRKKKYANYVPYDVNSGKSFIDYVSGVYTHCHEFHNQETESQVDYYFRKNCPTLFQGLKDIEELVFPEGPPIS